MKQLFKDLEKAIRKELGYHTELDSNGFLIIHHGSTNKDPVMAQVLSDKDTKIDDVIGLSVEINGSDAWSMANLTLLLCSYADVVLMEPIYYSPIEDDVFYGEDAYTQLKEDNKVNGEMLVQEAIRANNQLGKIYKKKQKSDLN